MDDLKLCPFCGGKAVTVRSKPTKLYNVFTGEYETLEIGTIAVGCETVDCILYLNKVSKQGRLYFLFGNEKLLEERWNRRATDD